MLEKTCQFLTTNTSLSNYAVSCSLESTPVSSVTNQYSHRGTEMGKCQKNVVLMKVVYSEY